MRQLTDEERKTRKRARDKEYMRYYRGLESGEISLGLSEDELEELSYEEIETIKERMRRSHMKKFLEWYDSKHGFLDEDDTWENEYEQMKTSKQVKPIPKTEKPKSNIWHENKMIPLGDTTERVDSPYFDYEDKDSHRKDLSDIVAESIVKGLTDFGNNLKIIWNYYVRGKYREEEEPEI